MKPIIRLVIKGNIEPNKKIYTCIGYCYATQLCGLRSSSNDATKYFNLAI